jgi:hypothetical protein
MKMITKKTAALFSATALVPMLLAGCLQVEQPLVVDETSRLLTDADFREYYCDIYHKSSYCGLEQTGATVIKNYSKDIWIYVNSVQGSVQLELAEEINGVWVTTERPPATRASSSAPTRSPPWATGARAWSRPMATSTTSRSCPTELPTGFYRGRARSLANCVTALSFSPATGAAPGA